MDVLHCDILYSNSYIKIVSCTYKVRKRFMAVTYKIRNILIFFSLEHLMCFSYLSDEFQDH